MQYFVDAESIEMLKKRHKCPHFRILVIGRANAGKTTILEKVCGVARGTQPIIYDKRGIKLKVPKPEPNPEPSQKHGKFKLSIKQLLNRKSVPSTTDLTPSVERGIHDIEHQITYPGSNFIFHDSQGFEAGASKELDIVWKFIEKCSIAVEMKDQLHAIWYCIPMDSPRPLLSAELEFFNKGTDKVPLVVIFTKFDAQIIQESVKLSDLENYQKRWAKAREKADITFQSTYLAKVLRTQHPPKAFLRLEDMHKPDKNCSELTQETANAIDDSTLQQLFVSMQMNNLGLCVKSALQHILKYDGKLHWRVVVFRTFAKFPHYWVNGKLLLCGCICAE
ncbi:hypothetical protein AX14_000509 [Amanita brunnescens Koide BX004]|nr:hypothetical protein AX14_000509 [Amanita brunnescens Koide BX004]